MDLELLFTVGEERSLAGASVFDVGRLRSRMGFVFDHASAIGEVIERSPGHFRLEARFRGAAAHAGIRPEDGRSAIVAASRAVAALPVGRVDEQTTINVGSIAGGGAINVVPEPAPSRPRFAASTSSAPRSSWPRSWTHPGRRPPARLRLRRGRQRRADLRRLPPAGGGARAMAVAEEALRRCGHEPQRIASGGGSDANALIAAGLDCVNLANGTHRPHEPGESVADGALAEMLEVALALVQQSLALEPRGPR